MDYRRQIRKTKSMLHLILFGDDEENSEDLKNKNIKQTGNSYKICVINLYINFYKYYFKIDSHF